MLKHDRRPLKDKSINRVLLHLRVQMIREGLEGLEHVEALMRLRGLDPSAYRVPPKNDQRFRNGALRREVLGILRHGPVTAREAGMRLQERYQDIPLEKAIKSVRGCLRDMKKAGLVRREGRMWLAP